MMSYGTEKKKSVTILHELNLFQVRQPFSMLLAAFRILDETIFKKVLKACSIISFRYNSIGGLNPNEQDLIYTAAALRITKESRFSLDWLRNIYPLDTAFETSFSNKSFKRTSKNQKIVKYLLTRIENHLHSSHINPFGSSSTVEHILPENPSSGWEHFSDEEVERTVFRLGNLTLLGVNTNRDLGAVEYSRKKEAYAASSFGITRDIALNYDEWNEHSINERQKQLAKTALQIWRLQFD